MVEVVALLLIHRQTRSFPYIYRGLPPFEGFGEFVKQSSPIWVFSLNHDLILEILAQHCGVPLRDGFWPEKTLSIPHIDSQGITRNVLSANILSEADLNAANFHLFNVEEFGINLLKLHGGLNIFSFRDGRDLCRLCPVDPQLDGSLRALAIANDELAYWHNGQKIHTINEISYPDAAGEMQFLQRTLLAGAQKFNKAYHQTLPHKMLEIFRSYINFVQRLWVIGYSFSDAHVDIILSVRPGSS